MTLARFYPHPIIAQEGWPFIAISVAVSVLVSLICGWWSLPFWLVTVFVVQFFRDPARDIPTDADAILSPADGRIVVVEHTNDPYREVPALKISVFMNVFNVHSNRSPIDGTVERVDYVKGRFVNADLDKASTENERNAVLAVTRTGRPVTFVQVAGLVARRILCYVDARELITRGQRYGFIRFGSRVDVYLPADAQAEVAIGDQVRASSTILARLPLEAGEDSSDQTAATTDAVSDDIIADAAERALAAAHHVTQPS